MARSTTHAKRYFSKILGFLLAVGAIVLMIVGIIVIVNMVFSEPEPDRVRIPLMLSVAAVAVVIGG